MKRQTKLGALYDNVFLCTAGSLFFLIAAPIVLVNKCLTRMHQRDTDLTPPSTTFRKKPVAYRTITDLQLQSRFAQLPGELRNKIYEHLIPQGLELHILEPHGKPVSLECDYSRPHNRDAAKDHYWVGCYFENAKRGNNEHRALWGLSILGLLCTCRLLYSEVIGLLYSRPTFIFQDYSSFLAYCASIPTNRFHSITSLRFIQTFPSYHGEPLNKNFPATSSYRTLRRRKHKIALCNKDLPKLQKSAPIDAWQHCCQILTVMEGLQSVAIDASAEAVDLHRYLGGSPMFWSDLKAFAEKKCLQDGFVVNVDVIPDSMPQLRKLAFIAELIQRMQGCLPCLSHDQAQAKAATFAQPLYSLLPDALLTSPQQHNKEQFTEMFFRSNPKYYASPEDRQMAKRREELRIVGLMLLLPFTPLMYLASLPFTLFKKYRKSDMYLERARRQEEQRTCVPPKVARRKRALSVSDKNVKKTVQQQQSPFFKLPAELRAQIYERVVGKREGIHVVYRERRLVAYRCQWSQDLQVPVRHDQCWNYYCNGSWAEITGVVWNDRSLEVLGLLQSCRMIYTEALPFLYSCPTFLFHDYTSVIAFSASLRPLAFSSLQSIAINQPPRTFSTYGDSNTAEAHLSHYNFHGCPTYSTLHRDKYTVRNPLIAPLTPSDKPNLDAKLGTWLHIFEILKSMHRLRELRINMYSSMFGFELHDPQHLVLREELWNRLVEGLMTLRKSRTGADWITFHISIDVVSEMLDMKGWLQSKAAEYWLEGRLVQVNT